MNQCTSERYTLLHASRKCVDRVASAGDEFSKCNNFAHFLVEVFDRLRPAEKCDVVSRAERFIERGVLRHIANLFTQGPFVVQGVQFQDPGGARCGANHPHQSLDQRGLASTVGSNHPIDCSLRDGKIDTAQGGHLAVGFHQPRDRGRVHVKESLGNSCGSCINENDHPITLDQLCNVLYKNDQSIVAVGRDMCSSCIRIVDGVKHAILLEAPE